MRWGRAGHQKALHKMLSHQRSGGLLLLLLQVAQVQLACSFTASPLGGSRTRHAVWRSEWHRHARPRLMRSPGALVMNAAPQLPPGERPGQGDQTGQLPGASDPSAAERIRLLEAQAQRAEEEKAGLRAELRRREEAEAAERAAAERAAAEKDAAERAAREAAAAARAAAEREAAERARQAQVQAAAEREKLNKLLLSIAIDVLGMATYAVPMVGEAGDVGWAPISAFLIYKLYGNGLISAIALAEELLPGLDFIPTATIAWCLENFAQAPPAPPGNSAQAPWSGGSASDLRRESGGMKSAQVVDETQQQTEGRR